MFKPAQLVRVTTTESLDPATVTPENFFVRDYSTAIPIAGTVNFSGTTAEFIPNTKLIEDYTYEAVVTTGIKDTSGNKMERPYTWKFTTISSSKNRSYLSAGLNNSAAIIMGKIYTWGNNKLGKLGNNDPSFASVSTPEMAGTDNDWVSVSAGETHTIALKSDGSLYAWGSNSNGQIGIDPNIKDKSIIPLRVGTDSDWVSIAAGSMHNLALKSDGTIYSWGYNEFGQLGNSNNTDTHIITRVGNDSDWAAIAAGKNHSLAVKTDGTLWAWGLNDSGQLGDGTTVNSNRPIQIGSDTDWTFAYGGDFHSAALKRDGTLYTWGNNDYGQLGTGAASNTPAIVNIPASGITVIKVSTGSYHTMALVQTRIQPFDTTLYGWGQNDLRAQLGQGNDISDKKSPILINNDKDWLFMSAGGAHSLAMKNNGTFWAWGDNQERQTGSGSASSAETLPVQLTFP